MFSSDELIVLLEVIERHRRSIFDEFLISLTRNSAIREFSQTIHSLLVFSFERQDAALKLLELGMLWDSDALMRPVVEASVNSMYICSCCEEARSERIREFWGEFSEINSLRQSNRGKILAALSSNESDRGIFADIILSDEEERHLRTKWSSGVRRKLQFRWSFQEKIKQICKFHLPSDLNILTGLAHYYGNSSHLLHADETALGLIADRRSRDVEERVLLEKRHTLRILNDSVILPITCFWMFLKATGGSTGKAVALFREFESDFSAFNIVKDG